MYYVVVIWHIGPRGDGPWPSGVGTKISNHCQVQKLILEHCYLLHLFTAMPSAKGPLWNHFWQGKKQNESQYRAHCHGCIEKMHPKEAVIEIDNENGSETPKFLSESWALKGVVNILHSEKIY